MSFSVQSGAEPIPGYRLIERIGQGGFGEVWKAEAPGGLHKAIKIVHGDVRQLDDDGSHRAEQELRALQRVQSIRHPYLLSLERYDVVDGRLVIVTELADGNLYDCFEEYRNRDQTGIPRDELLRYLRETAEVLDLMNRQHQLQHLDIKPQNLFLIHDHVKVADFGLVKDLEGMRTENNGGVTPVYAAPETFEGIITPFCDQYSLAIVYQELLTGHRPFAGTSVQQLAMQHLQAPPNLSTLPHGDRPSVARALAKKPENRHASCMAFVQSLVAGTTDAPVRTLGGVRVSDSPPDKNSRLPNVGESIRRLEHRHSAPYRPETPPTMMRIRREEIGPSVMEPPASRIAPPEFCGNGVLMPAIVVGIGRLGLLALKRLRQSLYERFGGLSSLPNLKLLFIDTDPETIELATDGVGGTALAHDEVLFARLNRASHYLKPRRNGRSLIEGWFDSQWLYRIPRNPAVNGQRALGRLAFGDHYQAFSTKFDQFLEEITNPDALLQADRHSKLGVRINRPRVYVVTGLGGGTGGGMFIDLAYAVRHRLRFHGFEQPNVVGILLAPKVDVASPARAQATANTFAAFTELAHYSHPDSRFISTFDDGDAAVMDSQSPFARFAVLPVSAEAIPTSAADGPMQAADFVTRELTLQFGRVLDDRRALALKAARPTTELSAATFGIAVITWPRRALLNCAARRLCQSVLARWTSRESAHMKSSVQEWVVQQWEGNQLGPEQLLNRLRGAACEAAQQSVEEHFFEMSKPFAPKGWFGGSLDVEAGFQLMAGHAELLGRPEDASGTSIAGILGDALENTSQLLVKDWGGRLAQLAVSLIEQPDFRLAGAEEAITHLGMAIDRWMTHYRTLADELGEKAVRAYFRMQAILNSQGSRRGAAVEFADLAKNYPNWRYESMLYRHAVAICQTLHADFSDQLGEISFCRQRLDELAANFRADSEAPSPSRQYLLPGDCATPNDLVDAILNQVSIDDVRELDTRMQKMVQSQFTALVHVCLSTSNLLGNLEPAMLKLAQQFLAGRLPDSIITDLFFERYTTEAEAKTASMATFDDAAPPLGDSVGSTVDELIAIVAPPGESGERLTQLAKSAIAGTITDVIAGHDDIAFFRELPRIPIAALPQMGPVARKAFQQVSDRDRFPPHTRTDVDTWLGPTR